MNEEDAPTTNLGTAGLLLPEFHYDLVARILPGVILIITASALLQVFDMRRIVHLLRTLTWPSLVALISVVGGAGYVFGMFLTWPQDRVRAFYIPRVWRVLLKRKWKLIVDHKADLSLNIDENPFGPNEKPVCPTDAQIADLARQIYGPLHDLLKRRNAQAQFVLPKMNAECGLFDQLCVGLLILCVLPLARLALGMSTGVHTILTVAGLLVTVTLCFFVARHRYDAYIARHFSYLSTLPPEA